MSEEKYLNGVEDVSAALAEGRVVHARNGDIYYKDENGFIVSKTADGKEWSLSTEVFSNEGLFYVLDVEKAPVCKCGAEEEKCQAPAQKPLDAEKITATDVLEREKEYLVSKCNGEDAKEKCKDPAKKPLDVEKIMRCVQRAREKTPYFADNIGSSLGLAMEEMGKISRAFIENAPWEEVECKIYDTIAVMVRMAEKDFGCCLLLKEPAEKAGAAAPALGKPKRKFKLNQQVWFSDKMQNCWRICTGRVYCIELVDNEWFYYVSGREERIKEADLHDNWQEVVNELIEMQREGK